MAWYVSLGGCLPGVFTLRARGLRCCDCIESSLGDFSSDGVVWVTL